MNIKSHSTIQISFADIIATITQYNGRKKCPLSPHKRTYIDVDALMLKHDKRVARELELWARANLE